MSAHALLGASGSKRWLNCTPSARAGEHQPSTTNDAADEGTCAHDLFEIVLSAHLGRITPQKAQIEYARITSSRFYNEQMRSIVMDYCNYVLEHWSMGLAYDPNSQLLIETHVKYDRWVPGGFGKLDVSIISGDWLVVIDLKYGQGVLVEIKGNTQTRLYAAGLWQGLPNRDQIRNVQMHIYQPRMKNIGKDAISMPELLDWLENYVKPRAQQAWAGTGDFVAGSHCKFCKNYMRCRALSEYARGPGRHEFKDPNELTDEEIVETLKTNDLLISWNRDVKEYALAKALKGHQWPGFKLTEGRSDRQITDPVQAAQLLYAAGYKDVCNVTLKGFGDLENMIGRENLSNILKTVIAKPAGKPTLRPENDVRKGFKSAANEFKIR